MDNSLSDNRNQNRIDNFLRIKSNNIKQFEYEIKTHYQDEINKKWGMGRIISHIRNSKSRSKSYHEDKSRDWRKVKDKREQHGKRNDRKSELVNELNG